MRDVAEREAARAAAYYKAVGRFDALCSKIINELSDRGAPVEMTTAWRRQSAVIQRTAAREADRCGIDEEPDTDPLDFEIELTEYEEDD